MLACLAGAKFWAADPDSKAIAGHLFSNNTLQFRSRGDGLTQFVNSKLFPYVMGFKQNPNGGEEVVHRTPQAIMQETLGDEVEFAAGFAFKSIGYVSAKNGIRLLRGDNIMQGEFRWETG